MLLQEAEKKFSILSVVVSVICFLLIIKEGGVDLEETLEDGAVLEGLERRHVRPVVDADAPHTDCNSKKPWSQNIHKLI
jgi:hypothetical protein